MKPHVTIQQVKDAALGLLSLALISLAFWLSVR